MKVAVYVNPLLSVGHFMSDRMRQFLLYIEYRILLRIIAVRS